MLLPEEFFIASKSDHLTSFWTFLTVFRIKSDLLIFKVLHVFSPIYLSSLIHMNFLVVPWTPNILSSLRPLCMLPSRLCSFPSPLTCLIPIHPKKLSFNVTYSKKSSKITPVDSGLMAPMQNFATSLVALCSICMSLPLVWKLLARLLVSVSQKLSAEPRNQ